LRVDADPKDFTLGVYGPQGGLAYEPDTVSMGKLFSDTNVDAVSLGQTVIYRTKDAESARRFTKVLFDDADADKTLKQIPPPPGLAKSRCIDASKGDSDPGSGHFQCVVTAGRYVFRVFSRQRNDVWQRAAAQYLMLTA
jgi:protein involved in temperature-dependent protein secretion